MRSLLVLSLLVALPAIAQPQHVGDVHQGVAPSQESVPERESVVFACGFVVDPPKSLPEWRQRAELVVRAKIVSQEAFEDVRSEWTTDIITAHEALVLDVIKSHPRAVAVGAVQQVLQHGGRIRRPDAWESLTVNGFRPLPVGSEWVMFLEWHARHQGFLPFYREHGAVQVIAGRIATPEGSLHGDWNGRQIEAFLDALAH